MKKHFFDLPLKLKYYFGIEIEGRLKKFIGNLCGREQHAVIENVPLSHDESGRKGKKVSSEITTAQVW